MASLQAAADAAKADVASTTTCRPSTVVSLKSLLLDGEDVDATVQSTARSKPVASKSKPVSRKPAPTRPNETLSARDRAALATHVINSTLKALSEAARPQQTPRPPSENTAPTGKRALRRSLSAPLSPAQPRALNRVATSPNVAAAKPKQPSSASAGCLATVECARVAFACLREAKPSTQDANYDFQLESGMCAFVGKLLALNMHEQAMKDLRLLKRRLDGAPPKTFKSAKTTAPVRETSPGVAELLEFKTKVSKTAVPVVANFQLHVLKLVAATKRPAHIESLLPVLDEKNPSSPISILADMAGQGDKEKQKAARQLASICQLLLSMLPSISSAEDANTSESRISPSPLAVFCLQVLAFKTQLRWWNLAGHKGNVSEEIIASFSRCARAFGRRHKADDALLYKTLTAAYNELEPLALWYSGAQSLPFSSPLSSLYQLLGSTAHAAKQYDGACTWFRRLKKQATVEAGSEVRQCSLAARILASALKKLKLDDDVEQALSEVTDSLEGSLSGTVAELNELLESLSAARRSVVGLLMKELEGGNAVSPPESVVKLLHHFTLRYPRFVRRWMGARPDKDAPTKQVLQFDQRKQLVMQSFNATLDAALMVAKSESQAPEFEWQTMDDVLQHCGALLDALYEPALSPARIEQFGMYHLKISTLYFAKFAELRKLRDRTKPQTKQMLQSLSRSIDAVKDRSHVDKEKAQLPMKLELFADVCKGSGRTEDAVGTLRSICTDMAEAGVLCDVASVLTTRSAAVAWTSTEKAATLSRTLRSIAKLDKSWNDWTCFLPETERAAILEHLMSLSAEASRTPQPLRLHDPSPTALLRIYSLERYPIRRFRVLLHLLYQNIGDEEQVAEISSALDETLRQIEKKDTGEDGGLSTYVPHLQAYYGSLLALLDGSAQQPSAMMESVSSWSGMLQSCATKSQVSACIDSPDGMIEFLQVIGNFSELRGGSQLQTAISELSVSLSTKLAMDADLSLEHSLLASRLMHAGRYSDALQTLQASKVFAEQNSFMSKRGELDYHLTQAEYFAGLGSHSDALDYIKKASTTLSESSSTWTSSKSQANLLLSKSSMIQSTIALQRGNVDDALGSVKSAVRTLSHEWAKLEASLLSNSTSDDASQSETSSVSLETRETEQVHGPRFWGMAAPLMRSLLQISSVYAHVGMFQETVYYAESAAKIAESTRSSLYQTQVAAWMGAVYAKAGQLPKAINTLEAARTYLPTEPCSSRVNFARQLGRAYLENGDDDKAHELFCLAEDTLRLMTIAEPEGTETTDTKTTARSGAPTKATRATASRAKTTTASRNATRKAAPRTKQVARVAPLPPKDVFQTSMQASIALSRAIGCIQKKQWSAALALLEGVQALPKLFDTMSLEHVVTATSLMGHSMEQMISDPVFSVMQDSTISVPAIAPSEASMVSPIASPPRRGRATTDKKTAKEKPGPAFADALRRAQDILIEAHGPSLTTLDSGTVHRISALLQSTIVLLSAAPASKGKAALTFGSSSVASDLGRNIAWRREQGALALPSGADAQRSDPDSKRRRSSLLPSDMSKFHKTYIELLPKNWSVVSLSLSDNCHDLTITKLQAGASPFILRLPLERANSRDADSEIFNFQHGKEEFLDIIRLANETSHTARDFSARGERGAWWAEREALDTRLKDLLVTIETTWLGGFKGIFSQHHRRPDLLARFRTSFQQMLDASLPSRNRMRGKKTSAANKPQRVQLDPRILDLFIGLGDPTDPDCDYDEALNDLLYFVVDILQFHGERNAYDEIDFDAMVVEMYDALRAYFSGVKAESTREDGAHTILVLDKGLHAFPWESLPCMEGLAVSRVPSLACLRQLMTEANASKGCNTSTWSGHYVSRDSGTYILNPSSDLKNTQGIFQPAFQTLTSWKSIVNTAPREAEFEAALGESSVLLYFGHGSGAQYIRGKAIRRLPKCKPATFLMGCSSAALTAAGEFECYGPVWNYMMAGCPAVVGTLWDVTDRDIDRFAGRTFEEWGLFERGTFYAGKRHGERESECDSASASLPEAVSLARDACKFRYLNAAAVVVYGIPVYIQ